MSSIILGLLVITCGVLLYLSTAGLLPPFFRKDILFSWPSLLAALGFVCLFSRHRWGLGLLLMLTGGFFLLPKFDIESFGFIRTNHWAILLVIIGLIILLKAFFGRSRHNRRFKRPGEGSGARPGPTDGHGASLPDDHPESGYIYRDYMFCDTRESIDCNHFKGGHISCLFGKLEIDLGKAALSDEINTLDISCTFSSIAIYAPSDWKIAIRQRQVFGKFEDRRPKQEDEAGNKKLLIINTNILFGQCELKCR